MKLVTQCPKTIFAVFTIAICVFVCGSQSIAKEKLNYRNIGKLKSKPKLKLSAPLVQVSTPVQIKNMPASWRDAELIVESMAMFLSEDDGMVGYSIGKTTKSNALSRGSYKGTVKVSANELHGDVTHMYIAISAVIAKKGNRCKVLGIGCKAMGKGGCRSRDLYISDAARPYAYPFLPGFIQSLKR